MSGPLLVIAGPGSGKTFSIVQRKMNPLLLGKAEPRHLVLCTFTEEPPFEMRNRLAAVARKAYSGDLSEPTVSTIHTFNRVDEHYVQLPEGGLLVKPWGTVQHQAMVRATSVLD